MKLLNDIFHVETLWRKFSHHLVIALWWLLAAFALFFVLTMLTSEGGVFAWLLGTIGDKQGTLKFIGLGMGGILAVIGAIALNQRTAAMAKHNKLIEKGHFQERFKVAVENLASAQLSARVASFYQFYNLAADNPNMRKNIFDILCAHLRQMTRENAYIESNLKSDPQAPTEECQSLLDILFLNSPVIFSEILADVRGIYIVGASFNDAQGKGDFRGATAREVDFSSSKLSGSFFDNVDLRFASFEDADLTNVSFKEADLRGADFSGAKNANSALFSDIKQDEKTKLPVWKK